MPRKRFKEWCEEDIGGTISENGSSLECEFPEGFGEPEWKALYDDYVLTKSNRYGCGHTQEVNLVTKSIIGVETIGRRGFVKETENGDEVYDPNQTGAVILANEGSSFDEGVQRDFDKMVNTLEKRGLTSVVNYWETGGVIETTGDPPEFEETPRADGWPVEIPHCHEGSGSEVPPIGYDERRGKWVGASR